MDISYSSESGVDGLDICLDIVSKLVERFEVGFTTDGSEVSSLEEGVLLINRARHGGLRRLLTIYIFEVSCVKII